MDGLVTTIEPMISAGSPEPVRGSDGWAIRTRDGSLSAHHEHTLVITRGEPVLLTAAWWRIERTHASRSPPRCKLGLDLIVGPNSASWTQHAEKEPGETYSKDWV